MLPVDPDVLALKAAALERHLVRVDERLAEAPETLRPLDDVTDSVVLHLWQAVQVVLDLGVSWATRAGLAPQGYGDAFRRLARARLLDEGLARRLASAAGFRNRVVHQYEELDLDVVVRVAREGPADLRAFLRVLRDQLPP